MDTTLEQLWEEFAGRLREFILRRVGDPATAEDILQDVFLKLHRQLGRLPHPAGRRSWLFAVTRNAIIDHYRTRKVTVPVPDTLVAEAAPEPAELAGLMTVFRRMIEQLPEPYRTAVVRTELDGLTQAELAAELGLGLSGAKSRVQRGRRLLRAMLEECCRFEFDRRGRVIDCAPRGGPPCGECG